MREDPLLLGGRQVEKSQLVGNVGLAYGQPSCTDLLRHSAKRDEGTDGKRLLKEVEILPVQIFDDSEHRGLGLRRFDGDGGERGQTAHARGAESAFSRDEGPALGAVGCAGDTADQDRFDDAVPRDAVRERRERRVRYDPPHTILAHLNLADGDLPHDLFEFLDLFEKHIYASCGYRKFWIPLCV